jgi:hypothetical protein
MGSFLIKVCRNVENRLCEIIKLCCVLQESAAVGVALDKFAHVLTEIQKYHMVCIRNTIHL